MNPFDLAGSPFLAFYVAYCAGVLVWLYTSRVRSEAGDPPPIDTSDPYLLAYLRGGRNHALSVAVLALVDRSLLLAQDDGTLIAKAGAATIARRPVERAILVHFASAQPGNSIFKAAELVQPAEAYDDRLRGLDLIPASETTARRMGLFLFAAGLILAVSAVKLFVASQRGRTNVIFLIILTIVATIVASAAAHPRLTDRGRRLLQDLQVLFDGVKQRRSMIAPGGASVELPLLAAVFGLSAVPESRFPYVKKLFPRASKNGGSTSSCGSCGGGCGSGCGGGGGGCGGCGG